MKKAKIFLALLFTFVLVVTTGSTCYAGDVTTSGLSKWSNDNYFTYNGDHSFYQYGFEGVGVAYCVQAGVKYSGNVVYDADDSLYGADVRARMTAAMLSDYDAQVKQMVLWCLADGTNMGNPGIGVGNMEKYYDAIDLYNYCAGLHWDGNVAREGSGGGGLSINGSLNFNYDAGTDCYVSDTVSANPADGTTVNLVEAPGGSWIDGTAWGFRVFVPRTSFDRTANVRVTFDNNSTGAAKAYTPATSYRATDEGTVKASQGYSQNLARPGMVTTASSPSHEETSGTVYRPKGNLAVAKKDNHDKYRAGAYFHITGPYGFDEYWESTTDVKVYENIDCGDYSVEELSAPAGMTINTTPVTVNVGDNQTVYAIIYNTYPRGNVGLRKYNEQDPNRALGDSTLAGATYDLYTAERIMEGEETEIYPANHYITTVTTDGNGNTPSVPNLPVGNYYYVETKPSTGFKINGERVPVTISFAGATSSVAAEGRNTAKETQILNYIEIRKTMGKTSITPEVPLDQCEFTVILEKYVNQYGSFSEALRHTSEYSDYEWARITLDDQGYGKSRALAYGHYVVSETTVNVKTLQCADFKVFIEKDYTEHAPYTAKDGTFTSLILKDTPTTQKLFDPSYSWLNADGAIVDIPKVMDIKIRKTDKDEYFDGNIARNPAYVQGDSVLKGAIYDIYRYDYDTATYSTDPVASMTIDKLDEEGYWYAEYKDLPTGKYKVIERVKSVDGHGHKHSHAEGFLVDETEYIYEKDVAEQDYIKETQRDVSKDTVERGRIEVTKYVSSIDGTTDKSPAANAILKLTLLRTKGTANEIYYTVKLDQYGYGEFLEKNDATHSVVGKPTYGEKYGKYQIPYGEYELTEIDSDDFVETHTTWYLNGPDYGEIVKIESQDHERIYHTEDPFVQVRLVIQKIDKDTNQAVILPDATFKVWDCGKGKFVTQNLGTGSDEERDFFKTNNEGRLELPHNIEAGDFILYEINAPAGYYLEDKYRLPKIAGTDTVDESKLGNETYGGVKFTIDKNTLRIDHDATTPDDYANPDVNVGIYFTTKSIDRPLVNVIKIFKHGEKFTDVEQNTDILMDEDYEETKPKYEDVPMQGARFKVTALEDIKSEDKTQIYYHRNDFWTFDSDSDGIALSPELYNGRYRVEEIIVPFGYKAIEPFEVELKNTDQKVRVKEYNFDLENIYQPVDIELSKIFEKRGKDTNAIYRPENEPEREPAKAVLGIFADQDFTNIYGTKTITQDTLIEAVEMTEGQTIQHVVEKLPDGNYYVRELKVSEPYMYDEDDYRFEVRHNANDHTSDKISVSVTSITNYPSTTDFKMIKISTTDLLVGSNATINTEEAKKESLNKAKVEITNTINTRLERGENLQIILTSLAQNGTNLLKGAEYEVYVDRTLKTHLQVSNDNGATFKNVVLKSDTYVDPNTGLLSYNGLYSLEGIPAGMYFLKEVSAPVYVSQTGKEISYDLSDEVVEIQALLHQFDDANKVKFEMLIDDAPSVWIEKTDVFTGKKVPNCLFTVTDSNDNELVKFITDEEGNAPIPVDLFEDGEKYYFTELEAENKFYYEDGQLYELNTTPHEFTFHVVDSEHFYFTSPVVDETGKVVKDENGEVVEKVNAEVFNYRPVGDIEIEKLDFADSTRVPNCKFELKNLETGKTWTGVTDKDGMYTFKNIPYGEYTYTEIEAPEEYDLDTTPHYIVIDTSNTKLVITNVKTGDIAVYAIAGIGVLSVLGIVFLVLKNKKAKANN